MPYYKGVYFEKAFHTEEDIAKHAVENPVEASEPVAILPATPPPADEEPPVSESEPDLAVVVPDRSSDRKTPIVDTLPAVDAEPDPFPSFQPEKEPETQPEEAEDPKPEVSVEKTPTETPDAKKKKKSGRSGG